MKSVGHTMPEVLGAVPPLAVDAGPTRPQKGRPSMGVRRASATLVFNWSVWDARGHYFQTFGDTPPPATSVKWLANFATANWDSWAPTTASSRNAHRPITDFFHRRDEGTGLCAACGTAH
jgi:hypothetical protein